MYAGITLHKSSGKFIGVHQKIDRAARRHLSRYIPKSSSFPGIKSILHFEGNNGPDAIKMKGSLESKPACFIDPAKLYDRALLSVIDNHIVNLSQALSSDNSVRAAFEAAWLAHAIVDGLTPAHHYPLNGEIKQICNEDIPQTINRRELKLLKKWDSWGTGGVLTHVVFEAGVALVISLNRFETCGPSRSDISRLRQHGFEAQFIESLHKIDDMKMYDEFGERGWTWHLANETKTVLVPEIIKVVALAWYQAIIIAEESILNSHKPGRCEVLHKSSKKA